MVTSVPKAHGKPIVNDKIQIVVDAVVDLLVLIFVKKFDPDTTSEEVEREEVDA